MDPNLIWEERRVKKSFYRGKQIREGPSSAKIKVEWPKEGGQYFSKVLEVNKEEHAKSLDLIKRLMQVSRLKYFDESISLETRVGP